MKKTLVSRPFDVAGYLISKCAGNIEIDMFDAMFGKLHGEFKGKKFYITFYQDEYLLISISKGNGDLLDELIPVLSEIMGNENPIAKYDLLFPGASEMPTIEWDIKDPEARIKSLVDGTAYNDGSKLFNIQLFDGRNIDDYIENSETAQVKVRK